MIEARAQGASGIAKCSVLKAWLCNDGAVFWELRRVFACLGYNAKDLNEFAHAHWAEWKQEWEREGMDADDAFRWSAKASRSKDRASGEYTRQEHALKTKPLLQVVIRFINHRRRVDERAMALSSAKQWFTSCHIHVDEADRVALLQNVRFIPRATCQLCGAPLVEGSECVHARHWNVVCIKVVRERRDEPYEHVAAVFGEKLNRVRGNCDAL